MANFNYTNFYSPYTKKMGDVHFSTKSKETENTEKSENSTEKVENTTISKNNDTIQMLETKITDAENKLKSQLELYKKIANTYGDVVEISGTFGRKGGWVQKTTTNATQRDIERFAEILEQTVSEKTVYKLQERLETLEKALEEIYVAIDSRMKQLGGTGKVYNTIYADGSRQFNGKIEHS